MPSLFSVLMEMIVYLTKSILPFSCFGKKRAKRSRLKGRCNACSRNHSRPFKKSPAASP